MKKIGVKLIYDSDSGEGQIQILESIKSESLLMQADVFHDWADDLRQEYEKALTKFTLELEKERK